MPKEISKETLEKDEKRRQMRLGKRGQKRREKRYGKNFSVCNETNHGTHDWAFLTDIKKRQRFNMQ